MNKALSILFGVAAMLAVQTGATVVESCGSSSTDATFVQLSNCQTAPCTLVRDTIVSISITFTPTIIINSLTTRVTALMNGSPGALAGLDGINACTDISRASNNMAATCPLEIGVEYIYRNQGTLSKEYPAVSSRLHWALQQNGVDVVCMEVDIKLE